MPRSVLIVDDEPNIRLPLEILMRRAGYEVRCAADGEAALASIAADPPDLVLLDIGIPRRNGYEVCQAVRANPAWSRIRILMVSAKGRQVEVEKGLALGADGYQTKPFSTSELAEKVRDLIGEP
ncbi:MAG: response regulator [Hyphomicrobiaceae bacterium]|nr:response regulator [Hyphomicrobiaceae bacterium]